VENPGSSPSTLWTWFPKTPSDLVRPGGLEPPNLRIKKMLRCLSGDFWGRQMGL